MRLRVLNPSGLLSAFLVLTTVVGVASSIKPGRIRNTYGLSHDLFNRLTKVTSLSYQLYLKRSLPELPTLDSPYIDPSLETVNPKEIFSLYFSNSIKFALDGGSNWAIDPKSCPQFTYNYFGSIKFGTREEMFEVLSNLFKMLPELAHDSAGSNAQYIRAILVNLDLLHSEGKIEMKYIRTGEPPSSVYLKRYYFPMLLSGGDGSGHVTKTVSPPPSHE